MAVSRRLVLVLDDYHVITNPRVHEAVAFLLDHRPAALELALATRSEPALPLGRLRVRGELVELRATELRLTDDEAAALLNRTLEFELDAADIARLQHRTEGWAAGLRLAALSLSGHQDAREFIWSFAGDDRPVSTISASRCSKASRPMCRRRSAARSSGDRSVPAPGDPARDARADRAAPAPRVSSTCRGPGDGGRADRARAARAALLPSELSQREIGDALLSR